MKEVPMSYKILSIDGGGVRGVIPGVVLLELARRLGGNLVDHFDLISGTSAGGQMALALTRTKDDGTPFWNPAQIDELYTRSYAKIFPFEHHRRFSLPGGMTHKKYEADGFESVLTELLGDSLMSTAYKEVLIPAYEVETGRPHFFTRHGARNENDEHPMKFVARATSSAPTFFEPKQHHGKEHAFIDGAVFANNPAMCAFAHAQSLGFDEDDMTVVSLGTGSISKDLKFSETKNWGLIHWARPLFDITSQASNMSIDWQLSHILRPSHYFRISPTFKDGRSAIDDAHPENMEHLRAIGLNLIKESDQALDELCSKLSE
jgi:patatin-like phospholipase/acyl hydrolase